MTRAILFFDIDGTLVDEESHSIPDSALEALGKAREKGHLLFVNTGRCKSFLPAALKAFDFDGYCYACGAHIEFQDQVLMEEEVASEDLAYIRDVIRENQMYGIFQGPEFCWFSQTTKAYASLDKFNQVTGKDYPGPRKSIDEDPSSMQVNKLVCFREAGWDEEAFHKTFHNRIEPKYQLFELGQDFYEILPLLHTKASCMDFLMDYFGINRDHCYVFGDSPNDLSMMRHVPNSICMGNGHPEVKREAAYVTSPINEDGIFLAMRHYGLI